MLYIKRLSSLVIVLSLALSNVACTTVKPVEIATDDIQERIIDGGVLKKGDKANIVTKDGKTHQIEVAGIREGVVYGRNTEARRDVPKEITIPVVDVVAVSKHEISAGKTIGFSVLSLLTATGVFFLVLLAALSNGP